MCNSISYYLSQCEKEWPINIVILNKACYTGYLANLEEIFSWSKNNDKNKIIYDKIIAKILETHKKINDLIESFNKKTDYKFKEVFEIENRNNYCDNIDCRPCSDMGISCYSINEYMDLIEELIENNNYNNDIDYSDIILNIKYEIKNMIEMKSI